MINKGNFPKIVKKKAWMPSLFCGLLAFFIGQRVTGLTASKFSFVFPFSSWLLFNPNFNLSSQNLGSKLDICDICGIAPNLRYRWKRVANGIKAIQNSHPWFVRLEGKFECGGALISNRFVITAAHCVYNYSDYRVILGKTDISISHELYSVTTGIKKCIIHPEYDDVSLKNDIALLEIDPVQFTLAVHPICLPANVDNLYANKKAYAIGFGVSFPDNTRLPTLQVAKLKTLSNNECNETYKIVVERSTICAVDKYQTPCNGDSGGPLIVEENQNGRIVSVVVGLTSYGFANICSTDQTVFTRTSYYNNWISQHVTDANCTEF